MLRRVACWLRVGLFLIGLVVSVWIPTSFFFNVTYWDLGPAFTGNDGPNVLGPGDALGPGGVFAVGTYDGWLDVIVSYDEHRISFQNSSEGFSLYVRGPFDWSLSLRRAAIGFEFDLTDRSTETGRAYRLDLATPLWLVAFICLAWPVTSFIIARRRRKGRGFEVEARPGPAVPPPES